jgi:cytidylate kinase
MKMEKKRFIVAVDGPAGSGKSSVCRRVAVEVGAKYIDSGAVYRAITWYFIDKYGDDLSTVDIIEQLRNINIEQVFEQNGSVKTFLNSKDVSKIIREERVAEKITLFSDNREVRDYVNSILRRWAGENSIVMDGRDIGSVVFPNADLKVYLDASVDERAKRRVKEYIELGKNVDENMVRNQIIKRDFNDENREFGPLKKCNDSVYLDTSNMSFNDVVEKIIELIKLSK